MLILLQMMGMSMGEQDKELRKYSGNLREEVKRQVDYNNAKVKKIKLNKDQTLHQDWYMKVVTEEDGYSLEDLTSKDNKEFLALEVDYQKDLLRAASAATKASLRTVSDAKAIDGLHRRFTEASRGKGSFEELRKFYMENVDKLDSTDMDTWSRISNEGIVPEEYKPLFSMIQTVDQKLAANDIFDREDALLVRNKMGEWYRSEFERLQKEPDPKKLEDQVDTFIKEVTFGADPFFKDTPYLPTIGEETKRAYETTPEDVTEMMTQVVTDPMSMDLESFRVASKELLTRADSPDVRFEAIGTALSRANELDSNEQEELVDYIKEHETDVYDRYFNLRAKQGGTVTSEDFISGLAEVFNGPK